ncbi:MAG: transporter associated domain-containing protein [Brevinema sp.]
MDDVSCIHRKEEFLKLLSTLDAEDILNPISTITVFDIDTPYEKIISRVKNSSHMFYPVYEHRIDNIIGLLSIKDLIGLTEHEFKLANILHAPFFISENTKLDELIIQLNQKMDFAIVVDEHGSVRGFITHADIRNALYFDEQNHQFTSEIINLDSKEFYLNAQMSLDEFNQKFHQNLLSEDCDTIGGFVIEKFTYVPQNEEVLTLDKLSITVKKSEGAKLLELALRLK